MASELSLQTPPGPPPFPGMRWIPGGTSSWAPRTFTRKRRLRSRFRSTGSGSTRLPRPPPSSAASSARAGYVTGAERPLDPEQYPDADPELLVRGSLVFRMTAGPVPLEDVRNWWEYVPGTYWKRPGGSGTTINGRDRHPVRRAHPEA